nr:HAMP domain-containing sensor histidine kinase [Nocardioides sp. MAH-18]
MAVLGTYVAVVAAVPSSPSWPWAATTASLMILPAALCASVCAWVAWRLCPHPATAWFTAATAMMGVQWPLLLLDPDDAYDSIGTVSSSLVVGTAILLLVWVATRFQLRVAPVPVGVGLGILLLLIPIAWAKAPFDDVWLPSRSVNEVLGVTALVAIGAFVAVAVLRTSTLPVGVGRLAVAAFLWSASTALGVTDLAAHPAWSLLAVAVGLATAILVISVSVDLLLLGMRDKTETVRALERELLQLRDQTRTDVEHLHEVKGTIAGIASASAMISSEPRLSVEERARLTEMLTTESARLSRMFDDQRAGQMDPMADIDQIIRPLVVARRVQGQDVVWYAPTDPITVPADPTAEVVNILLHNAAEHAPGAPVWVYTRDGADPERTELVVVDLGPGIHESHQSQVFQWGWRGSGSRGRGVGLAIAAEAVVAMGGKLRLEQRQRRGTCFVVELPPQSRVRGDRARADDEAVDV